MYSYSGCQESVSTRQKGQYQIRITVYEGEKEEEEEDEEEEKELLAEDEGLEARR